VLVLTRRKNEVIRVCDAVQVIVLAVKGNEVHLGTGIVAPQDVIVDREEVAERKRRERDARAQ
jgi:carbon storage regulator